MSCPWLLLNVTLNYCFPLNNILPIIQQILLLSSLLCLKADVFYVKTFSKYSTSQVSKDVDDDILKAACVILVSIQLQKN